MSKFKEGDVVYYGQEKAVVHSLNTNHPVNMYIIRLFNVEGLSGESFVAESEISFEKLSLSNDEKEFVKGDKVQLNREKCEDNYIDVSLFGLAFNAVYTVDCVEGDTIRLLGSGILLTSEYFEPVARNQEYEKLSDEFLQIMKPTVKPDAVNSPKHYCVFEDVEAIQVIASSMTQQQFYGYCLGNILKYRLRAGGKDDVMQELGKADKYQELYTEHKHLCRG